MHNREFTKLTNLLLKQHPLKGDTSQILLGGQNIIYSPTSPLMYEVQDPPQPSKDSHKAPRYDSNKNLH